MRLNNFFYKYWNLLIFLRNLFLLSFFVYLFYLCLENYFPYLPNIQTMEVILLFSIIFSIYLLILYLFLIFNDLKKIFMLIVPLSLCWHFIYQFQLLLILISLFFALNFMIFLYVPSQHNKLLLNIFYFLNKKKIIEYMKNIFDNFFSLSLFNVYTSSILINFMVLIYILISKYIYVVIKYNIILPTNFLNLLYIESYITFYFVILRMLLFFGILCFNIIYVLGEGLEEVDKVIPPNYPTPKKSWITLKFNWHEHNHQHHHYLPQKLSFLNKASIAVGVGSIAASFFTYYTSEVSPYKDFQDNLKNRHDFNYLSKKMGPIKAAKFQKKYPPKKK